MAQPPRTISGDSVFYPSGDSEPFLDYDFGQSSSGSTPVEARDEWYTYDNTEGSYTSVTDASNPWRHGASLPRPNSYLAEETTRGGLLIGQEVLTPPREHKRELTIPHPPPRVSATVEGVPEWLLPLQHHELFPTILKHWTKFINPASRGSSSGGGTAAYPRDPPSCSASSSRKGKRPSGRRKTKPEDTKDDPDGLGTLADEEPAGAGGPEKPLACHYYKLNAVEFIECHRSTFQDARSARQHLRNKHGVTSQQVPRVPALDGEGEPRKWYWTWRELFPGHAEPCSPYHDPLELLNQFSQRIIQQECRPEVLSAISSAISSFAGRSSFRQLSNPARPEDEETDRRNDTPQPNDPGTTDRHTSPSLGACTSGSPLSRQIHPNDENQDIGAGTDAASTPDLSPIVHFLQEDGMTYDDFQPTTVVSEDQDCPMPAAGVTPTEFSDQYQYHYTAFASGPGAQFIMPDIASGHGFHNDEMDLDDNLQGNGSQWMTLPPEASSTSSGTVTKEDFRTEGWGHREETSDIGPHAWGDGNDLSGLRSTGSGSRCSVSEDQSSFFDDAFSWVRPSGASGTNPSTVSHGNTGEQSCYESSETGEDRWWA